MATAEILDGRNRAIVVAKSPARRIIAIRITSIRWWSRSPPKKQNLVLTDTVCVAAVIRSLMQHSFQMDLWNGLRQWLRSLSTSDWQFGPFLKIPMGLAYQLLKNCAAPWSGKSQQKRKGNVVMILFPKPMQVVWPPSASPAIGSASWI